MTFRPVVDGRTCTVALAFCASLALCSATLSCATNPVTGERQIMLISEAQEIEMVQGVSQQAGGGGRLPEWLSTHPDPGNRRSWAVEAASSVDRDVSKLAVNRERYLQRIDGIVFGENPREGFFQENLFRHPELAFQLRFPAGWQGSNQKTAVGAVSPNEDALVVLQLADAPSAQQAARQFFSNQGIVAGENWRREIGGFPAVSSTFQAQTEQGVLQGLVAWVEYGGRVYQLLGYTAAQRFGAYQDAFTQSLASFRRETDRQVLNVQPRRLDIVKVDRAATVEALNREYPSTVPVSVVSLINNVQPNATVSRGQAFKRVVGGPDW